ncbi:hypothetical protein K4K50_009028 [Colletotrichum sp. SAR 10_71]|nr:hypothetical protein K4K50_009028 [Colletotrichum sp. SAR 10_71]KAJ4999906.1 hypothetical protein K4K48_003359 [Colletotrichum sp. SAR 10_66]
MTSLPQTYKAAVIKSVRAPLEIVDQELKKPGPGQVLVKVLACGVCHSDVVVQEGGFGDGLFPRVPGHEIIGDVVAVGDGVSRFQGGERVGGAWHGGHDGTCPQCQKGFFQTCQNTAVNGVSMDGGYAEYVLLRDEAVVRVPKNMDPADSAPLLCAGVTVFNSIRKQGIEHGSLVVIQGLGGLGHLGVQYANKMGYKVAVLSSGSSKKEFATKLGAHEYIDTSAEDPVKRLQELGGAALIVATAPHAKAISPLTGGLMPGGKLLVLAPVGKLEVDSVDLIIGGKSVGGWPSGHQIDTEAALDFAATHGVKCMVEKFPLTEARKASEHMISNTRTPQDIWFISGVSLAVLPWPDDPLKSKALFLNPIHARRLGGKYDKPPKGADETKDFHYRKRTIWINLVVLFRLLLMAQHLSFDHDNFWKFVRLNWGIGTNVSDIKFIVNLYADRRDAYLNNRHIQRRHEDLLTDLIDAWVTRGGDLPLPRWPRRDDITAEWERLYADWDRFLQHGDYSLLIDPDDPPTLGRFPEDRGTPAPFRIKGEGLRSRSQSTGYDRDQSSTRTSMAPPPRNNDPQPPPSPPSRPLTPNAMEVTVDELIESEGNPAQKRKPQPGELDPTPTKRRCIEDDLPSPWARAPSPALDNVEADATHSESSSKSEERVGSLETRTSQYWGSLSSFEMRTNAHEKQLGILEAKSDHHKDKFCSLEAKTGKQETALSFLKTKVSEHEKKLKSPQSHGNVAEQATMPGPSKADAHAEALQSLQEDASKQSEALQSVEQRVDDLERKSSDQSHQLGSHQKQIDDQKCQLDNHHERLGDYHRQLDDHHNKIVAHAQETLLQSLQDKAGADENMTQSLQELEAKASHLQTTIGNYRAELDTLKLRLAKSEETTSQLGKTSVHSAAFTILSSKVDGNLGRLVSMEETVAQLTKNSTTKLNEHMNILNSLRASTARLDKTSVESKATLDSLQAKVDRQSEQSQTVAKTIDSFRKMNDVFNAMLDSLEAKVDHQSEQSQVVAKAVDSLKGMNDELNTKVESLETDFGKYRDQFHTLKTVVDSLEKTTSESANVKTLEATFGEHKAELHALQKAVGDFDRTTVEHDENIRALQEQVKLVRESGDLSRDVHKAHNDLTVFTASQCQTALEKLDTFAADLSSLRKEVESCRQTTDEAREWQAQREEANKNQASLLDIESMAARRKEQREQLDRDHKLDTRIKIADDRISRVDASAKVTTKTLKGIQYRQQEFAEEVDDRLATTGKHLASVMARVELLRNSMDESMSARLSKLESGLKSQSITSPAVEERLARMEDAIQTNTTLIGNCRTLVEVSKTSLDQQFSTLSNRVSLLEQRLNRRMAEQEQSAKAQAMRMDRLEAALAQQMGTNSQFRG